MTTPLYYRKTLKRSLQLLSAVGTVLLLLILPVQLKAQCTESNLPVSATMTNGELGQSFTACADGKLSTLSVSTASGAQNPSANLIIYQGTPAAGSVLATIPFSSITFVGGAPSDYTVIDLSGENISVSSGATYSFEFSDIQSLYYNQSDSYGGGTVYSNGSSVIGYDFIFKAEIAAPVNNAPQFNSSSTASFNEESTGTVLDVNATDGDGGSNDAGITYTLSGGTDQGLFTINSSSGELTFNSAPDFENAADNDGNNDYEVQVQADDGSKTAAQSITVTVNDINEGPVFNNGSSGALTINEDAPATAINDLLDITDDDISDNLTWSVSSAPSNGSLGGFNTSETSNGGSITPAGLTYTPDSDYNGSDNFDIQISDGTATATTTISVTVDPVNDAPTINSSASVSVDENATSVITVSASDVDDASLNYSISGGVDQSLFSINSTNGDLNFNSAPDFENPGDDNADNDYIVQVGVSDGTDTTNQIITVSVNNLNDNSPVFTSGTSANVAENSTSVMTVSADDADAGSSVSYSISGGVDQTLFSIGGTSGDLTFDTAPDFENPADDNTDNDYIVQVTASDGTNTTNQTITVSVTDKNDNTPVFNSPATKSIEENTQDVMTVSATDNDAGTSLTYSISGGADQSLFTINNTGMIAFKSVPDFEAALDDDNDNTYQIEAMVSDGANSATQSISINVENINEAPEINGSITNVNAKAGDSVNVTISDTLITDPDEGDQLSLTIEQQNGNALPDWLSFNNNKLTGLVPETLNKDTVFNLTLVVTDQAGAQTTNDFTLTITETGVNGLADGINKGSFKCYPTPSQGQFHLEIAPGWQGARLMMESVNGEVIKRTTVDNIKTSKDWSDLSSGVYLIHLIKGQQQLTLKWVKQ